MIDAQEALQQQVQSELDTAKGLIETISHMLEQRVSVSTMFNTVRIDYVSRKTAERWMIKVDLPALMSSNWVDQFKDDFRTILLQARGHVKTLISLSRTVASPSASPGTSTASQATTLHDPETTRTRIDVMTKLIGLLQRNLRVQYELDVVQVAHA
jgi:rapamycin-insensitive companion of mTOR